MAQQNKIELIKKLLNMDKQDKVQNKIQKLETLLQGNMFLDKIQKEDKLEYNKLLYNATFEQFHPKQIVQILGNYASKFYVILEGSVDVFIRDRKDEDSLYGARQLVEGDCMNEVALITGDKSLVQYQVSENEGNCSVLVLQKKDFQQIAPLVNIWLDMSLFYMKNLPLFWNQNEKYLRLFYLLSTHESYVKNQQVFLEGDKSDLVYIISQGEFGVYKHFQDLQFRKLNDVSHNKYLDSLGTTTVKLQEFHHNKNILTKILKDNEMFGEEDIINRRCRTFSVICESNDGDLIVMSKATFKILLMGIEGVRNYIQTKLKVKQTEVSRILDKQASQVSSARIHILEKDQLKIATTQDFVKSRSFLNFSRNIYQNSNMSKIGESILANTIITNNNNSTILDNASRYENINNNIKVLKSVPREQVNHILNQNNLTVTNQSKKNDPSRLSLPQINQYDNILQQQQQIQSTKVNRPQGSQPKRINYSFEKLQNQKENEFQLQNQQNQLNINYNESKVYNPSISQLQQIQKSEQSESLPTTKRIPTETAQPYSININLDQNTQSINIPTPKVQQDLQNHLSPKQFSSNQLDGSQTNLQERNETTNRAGDNSSRRDSKFFENFTRNSTLYLQKYQINKEKKALFSVGKKNDQNDELMDQKGRQLSDQIQQYILKYEQQINKFMRNASKTQDDYRTISPQAKVIYKKPLSEEEYAQISKKQSDEPEDIKNIKERNFKINVYEQK
ncbi:cyclic nucleotide-binding domain protein (macronuclear) [Tetrahymena thermophila SB210]|uniref:Cyclic nucleotide-binding domain protein n=1 Tax=Tetrahymena thermophila (strain SB210) TaxID=312017 RepID=Q23QL7_TETTS|nr:cyclic nucleotide-binding domain protein [Tetrahymena thermophila SB210]EAR98871.3 cyclic nucleotide-binding domain protein [Tetrahymena thermophila SB210]|eukprot:XP_001019116.3 cyclic nucleotide-binding domain protein [Tetrahymena thermophila SB210]